MLSIFPVVLLAVFWKQSVVDAQGKVYSICVTSQFESLCPQLQRGNSEVNCQRVQDSIECAQRIRNGTADFGIFTAESSLHLAKLQWDSLTVIKELRHRERISNPADYESVVVVRADHKNGIEGLRDTNFCHPGYYYDKTLRWSERFLKHFERNVVVPDCKTDGSSPAEIETAAFAKYFKKACRPGQWSNNLVEDARLKANHPQLCELCNSPNNVCEYGNGSSTDSLHIQALQCLTSGGQVTYVSLDAAQQFYSNTSANPDLSLEYAYLCPNGTKQQILNNNQPCVWLRQPWNLIIANKEVAMELSFRIKHWVSGFGSGNWESAIREIITANSYLVVDTTIQTPRDHFRLFRDVPVDHNLCNTQSVWCTTSIEEKDKCEVIRAGGITTGVYPTIECREPASSTVSCLEHISKGRADFIGVDSNFGFIARHPHNLTSALYAETETEKYASVVVVIRASSSFERFENLRGSKACFGEFGSIASVAFINTGKNRGFFNKNQCLYGALLSEFFGPSCAPGALDLARGPKEPLENLCSLCRSSFAEIGSPALGTSLIHSRSPPLIRSDTDEFGVDVDSTSESPTTVTYDGIEGGDDVAARKASQGAVNCNADASNRFYGNKGALQCLSEEGDVAVLELQYLKDHAKSIGINPNDFRIICRNGSLASTVGFDVDLDCALTTIVDGEVLVARNNPKTPGIINALNSFDRYFQIDPDFKLYNVFAGQQDLLFKDSTIGLVARDEENLGSNVENYRKLFENLDACVQGNGSRIPTVSASFLVLIIVMIFILF